MDTDTYDANEKAPRPRNEPAVCLVCARPCHRFATCDPEHDWDGVACVNGLLAEIKRKDEAIREAHKLIPRAYFHARGILLKALNAGSTKGES